MKKRRNSLFCGFSFLLILVVFHFFSIEASAQSQKGVMKGAWHFNISTDWLDPSITTPQIPNFYPLYFFHDALIKPMPDALYSPCLAESWTISPDYRTYKFKLRKGVKFHNGDEMTAEDVVFTFNRYKGGPASMLRGRIEKLEAESPYLFSVTFKAPFPDFLEYLLPGASSIAWIVPKKYVEKVGDAEYKRKPVGCGPYKFVEFKAGIVLVGEAFENFWRKVPKVKRFELYSVTERSTRYAMAKRGEMDFATSMTDVFYDRVKKDPDMRMLTGLSPNYQYIYLAAQWDPKSPWSDARVRKAASLAIKREPLSEVVYPEGGLVDSLGLPGDPESVSFPVDPYDPDRARKLLAEAGYPKGFRGGKFYYFQEFSNMGEMIATDWKSIGIECEMIPMERSLWLAQHHSGKMAGGIFTDFVGGPTVNTRLNYLFGPQNYGNYPDIKTLWNEYNQALDPKVRKDLIGRMQRLMHERTMIIPTIKSAVPTAMGPRVKGNPFKMSGGFPIWFPCPIEDYELNE
ncbi:MAG: ABC transporter substrate-binding protein [Deltaproteobacteria bacterium]|nr:MAG: ABC transporter substrate-binding protein [Deltaproteobacteria bacterium]